MTGSLGGAARPSHQRVHLVGARRCDAPDGVNTPQDMRPPCVSPLDRCGVRPIRAVEINSRLSRGATREMRHGQQRPMGVQQRRGGGRLEASVVFTPTLGPLEVTRKGTTGAGFL
jgi:hypothetical protein